MGASAGSESWGGCDPLSGWVDPLATAVGIGLVIWIAALLFVIARAIKRRLGASS